MPLTPLHLGPGLLLGTFTLRFFNLWALLLGSVLMDVEPVGGIIIRGASYHGFLHTILGAVFGSLVIAAILYKLRGKLEKISLKFKIRQSFSFPVLFFSSLTAWLIHIFFDSLVHIDVFPFWPSRFNPIFIGKEIYWPLSFIFLILGIFGLILIIRKIKTYD